MKVSFLLPTSKPFDLAAKTTVQSLYNAIDIGIDYEVVLYSEESIDMPKVRCIKEEIKEGSTAAFNKMYQKTLSDYIVVSTDDHQFDPNIFSIFLKMEHDYKKQRFNLLSIPTYYNGYSPPCYLDEDSGFPPNHGVPHCVMPRFPVIHSKTIDEQFSGLIYNLNYKHHYADSWMGYWMWANGQEAKEYDKACVYHFGHGGRNTDNIEKYKNIFLSMIKDHKEGKISSYA